MPLAANQLSKAPMSLEELATCEVFLDSHREYAAELLSDIEVIRQWHMADNCPETRQGQPCQLCELCDENGLLKATKKVLKTYGDADARLQQVRASFGKNARVRGGAHSTQTLFTSPLAKAVFLSIATVGENLRSHHATWSVRLQSIVTNLSATGSQHVDAVSGSTGYALSSTFVDPAIVDSKADSKLSDLASGLGPGPTFKSPVFLVLKRCLRSGCSCDANQTNAESTENVGDTRGSQATPKVSPSPLKSKTRKSKATRSSTVNPPSHFEKASDTRAQAKADAEDVRACDMPGRQGMMPRQYEPSSPASGTTLSGQETEPSSPSQDCEASIVDPRVFHLRAEVERSNGARRALIDWCRAWVVELQSEPQERHETGSTNESLTGHTQELSISSETVEPQSSPRTTLEVRETMTRELSHGNEAMVQEISFNTQEELKEQWSAAQRKQSKRLVKPFGSRLRISK